MHRKRSLSVRDIEAPSSVFNLLLGKDNCQFYYEEAGEVGRLRKFDQVRPGITRRRLDRFLDLVWLFENSVIIVGVSRVVPSHVGPCLRGGASMFVEGPHPFHPRLGLLL